MSEHLVKHNPQRSRFEAEVEGQVAVADYRMEGDRVMAMTHTLVPPELEGRGIAAALAKGAFEHAKEKGLKIRPLCSYVAGYVARHPELKPLVVDR